MPSAPGFSLMSFEVEQSLLECLSAVWHLPDMLRLYQPCSKSWIKVKNKKHPAMLRVKKAFELERLRRG
jgi:hypothetical protein